MDGANFKRFYKFNFKILVQSHETKFFENFPNWLQNWENKFRGNFRPQKYVPLRLFR